MAQDGQRQPKHDMFSALRVTSFRNLIAGRLVAQLGETMVSVGIGWELYERTGEAFALGLVGLVQVIPIILLSLPGGYVADRYNRRNITAYSQLVLVLCALALAAVSLTEGSLVILYGVLAVIGAARAFNNPAESALTPQIVPEELYYNAGTWDSMVWQTSAIVGPALAGLIIAVTASATPIYFFNALAGSVLIVTLLLLKLRPRTATMSHQEPPLQALRGGLRFVRHSEIVLAAITLDMFAVMLGGVTFLLPVFAKDILDVGATGLGIMRAAPSIGALAMAAFLARRPPLKRSGPILLWSVAGFGVATIIFGVSKFFPLSLAMLVALGALDMVSVIVRRTVLLVYIPDDMRGRVLAVNYTFIGASNELGGFESGVAAAILGTVGSVVFGGIGTLVVVGFVAKYAPHLRQLGEIAKKSPPKHDPAVIQAALHEQALEASD